MNRLTLLLLVCFGCNPQTDTGDNKSVETTEIPAVQADTDGVSTASFNADSENQQRFSPGSGTDLGTSSVTLPPGALAVSGDVSVGTGPSLLDDSDLTDLGADGATSSGAPMMISSSEPIQANSALAISLDTGSGAALTFDSTRFAMLFKVEGAGFINLGIIPRSKLLFAGRVAKTSFSYPQAITRVVFQAIQTPAVITKAAEVTASVSSQFSSPGTLATASGDTDDDQDDGGSHGSGYDDGSDDDSSDDGGITGPAVVELADLASGEPNLYLNLEDYTTSGVDNRDQSAELEFTNGNLHTTCDDNKMIAMVDKAFEDITYDDMANKTFFATEIPAAEQLIVAIAVYDTNVTNCEVSDTPLGFAKIRVEGLETTTNSVVKLQVETLRP